MFIRQPSGVGQDAVADRGDGQETVGGNLALVNVATPKNIYLTSCLTPGESLRAPDRLQNFVAFDGQREQVHCAA